MRAKANHPDKSQSDEPAKGGMKPAQTHAYASGDSFKPHGDPLRHLIEEEKKIPASMPRHEDVAKVLKARLTELIGRIAKIDSELREPLSADSEDQAADLENQDALEGIENTEIQETRQIQEALARIAKGTYGVCTQCGADIDPKRLKALPVAAKCISCAA